MSQTFSQIAKPTVRNALTTYSLNQVKVLHRPRLLSDNGPSYVSSELGKWLEDNGIRHIRGRPYHPMTQGKIERYHRSMKNRILLDNYYLPGQLEQNIEEFVRDCMSSEHFGQLAWQLRECLAHLVKGSGCDCLLMQAASLLVGFSFDLFPPFENGLAAPEVDVSRRQVVQALVVSTVVVVPDELLDVLFELSWQVVVVQQNPVFHRAMISLDLALRHRVVRPAADMSDAVVLKPLTKLARHVGWTVIAQQPWPMQNLDLVQT